MRLQSLQYWQVATFCFYPPADSSMKRPNISQRHSLSILFLLNTSGFAHTQKSAFSDAKGCGRFCLSWKGARCVYVVITLNDDWVWIAAHGIETAAGSRGIVVDISGNILLSRTTFQQKGKNLRLGQLKASWQAALRRKEKA